MLQHINDHLSEREALAKWYSQDGERLRLEYDLSENDLVFDIGGHHGDWALDIMERYDVKVWVFEPVAEHIKQLHERFDSKRQVRIIPAATGVTDRKVHININGTGSTIFGSSINREEITEIDFCRFIIEEKISNVALCKVNIEGGEFDLLENIIRNGLPSIFKDIQIQFHNIFPDAVERRNSIREMLRKTHKLTYDYPFVWENWSRID